MAETRTDLCAQLSSEHRVVLANLERLEAALERPDLEGVSRALAFFQEGLVAHRRKEEEVLFPALARHLGSEGGPVGCMLHEHRMEAALLESLRSAVVACRPGGGDSRRWIEAGMALVGHLRDHIAKEDQVLFPMAEQLLGPGERLEVETGMAAIGGCCPECASRGRPGDGGEG
ncbi:MAG: hemerythrin domain-containing protein [Planctomycetes bacterium]|nr:hemerythrin domain-containing protein [Planctomycetota bacterium]